MRATNDATDLTLCVRLRVSSDLSKLSLASKFGAMPGETKALLFAARQAADALGICFHVGSQAMAPEAYVNAMERVRAASGRASCRERACPYVSIWVVAGSLKKKNHKK